MRRPTFLQTVLVLRRHREDAEERVLTAIQCEIRDAIHAREHIDKEVACIGAARRAGADSCTHGIDHHRTYAFYRRLLERQVEIDSRIEKLKEKQVAQLSRYLKVRQEREVISNLEEKRIRACNAESASREIKQMEDLFLARFGRR